MAYARRSATRGERKIIWTSGGDKIVCRPPGIYFMNACMYLESIHGDVSFARLIDLFEVGRGVSLGPGVKTVCKVRSRQSTFRRLPKQKNQYITRKNVLE